MDPFSARSAASTTHTGPQRHQARLVNAILLLMAAYLAVIGSLNLFLFADYGLAALDYIGMVCVLATLAYFRRSRQLLITSWIVVAVVVAVMLVFIHMADGRSYSLMWITLLPPVTFFLLGRRAGAWICAGVFLYIALFVYLRLPHWTPAEPGLGTWLNTVEILTAHWFLFRLYEKSRAEAFAELEHLSETDKLTGLLNRSRLDAVLQQELERHHRSGQPLTVVLCDVDHFKQFNDEFGHLTGDRILGDIAGFLRTHMRAIDICGRWGGEEFLIICPDTPAPAAHRIVDRLRAAAREQGMSGDIPVTLSFGIATLEREESAEQLLRRSDRAMYEAKRGGRDQVVLAE
ncbi:MAG: GGDEF domain-containing protein [Pseudomonadota bacterium]